MQTKQIESFIRQFREMSPVFDRLKQIALEYGHLAATDRAVLRREIVLLPEQKTPSLGRAIDDVLKAKQNANRSTRYVRSLGYYLRQFAREREKMPLAEITTESIEAWLSRYPCAYTRQTWLNRISTLFSFAVRRGYITANPCDRIERVSVDRKPPLILSPGHAKALLKATQSHIKPYVILAMYAGIRPEEITRLDWSAINLETRTVKVDGKTRRRRIVPLEPIAVKLLAKYRKEKGPVTPSLSTLVRWKNRARKLIGQPRFPQDLLRHTAASYLLALHQDAGKVSMMLGNSSKILLSHYHEPVAEKECKGFWECK